MRSRFGLLDRIYGREPEKACAAHKQKYARKPNEKRGRKIYNVALL